MSGRFKSETVSSQETLSFRVAIPLLRGIPFVWYMCVLAVHTATYSAQWLVDRYSDRTRFAQYLEHSFTSCVEYCVCVYMF